MMPHSMDNLIIVREVGAGPCACPNPGIESSGLPETNSPFAELTSMVLIPLYRQSTFSKQGH